MAKTQYVAPIGCHLIASRYVDQTYEIRVMQPLKHKDNHEPLPVVYLTDGNESFDVAKGISHNLQAAGLVRKFVLVGIGYPGANPFAGDILRVRDLTPPRRPPIPDFPRESPIEGVEGIEAPGKNWGGADEFLAFIQEELIPLIEKQYRVLQGERAYFGHSFGAGFGLHALLSGAGLFRHYILSSPGVIWDGNPHGLEPVREFIASGHRLEADLFVSVGGDEELEPRYARSQFCTGFYRLTALLRKAQIQGLKLTTRLFPGESHASVWPLAFTHGLQVVLGPR